MNNFSYKIDNRLKKNRHLQAHKIYLWNIQKKKCVFIHTVTIQERYFIPKEAFDTYKLLPNTGWSQSAQRKSVSDAI